MRPLLERGELPHVARLISQGVAGPLRTIRPTLSPVIWTSVVTGVRPTVHGIDGFLVPDSDDDGLAPKGLRDQLAGVGYLDTASPALRFYRSSDRRADALWNRVEAAGKRATAIGWWITYPVEPLAGGMVSDRYLYDRFELEARRAGLDYERRAALVYPPDWEPALAPLVVRPEDITAERLRPFLGETIDPSAPLTLHDPEAELRIVLAKDESMSRFIETTIGTRHPDLLLGYFQGADISSHYFWKYRFPESWNWVHPDRAVSETERARFGGVIDTYYRFLDKELGRLLETLDERTAIILCSDHGFVVGTRDDATTISGVHAQAAPPGIIVMAGAGIRRGERLDGASIYDVAPTVLDLLGIPFENLEGRVLTEALVAR